MQNIDDVKLKVGNSNFISAFDAKSGYWLINGKCEFGKNSVKYVGHIIGSGRHEPDPELIQAAVEMLRPITKKQTRQVLGMLACSGRTYPILAP